MKKKNGSNKKYILRSLVCGGRILRPRLHMTSKMQASSYNLINDNSISRKKRKRKTKGSRNTRGVFNNEFSGIKKRFRYILNRMNYEQNLINAYSGEGWKGLSLEKVRLEKEIQRATSELFKCKLKMRNLLQYLDSLCAKGRFNESLFDSEGQISCEDIFCSKCGSKDVSVDNDIILCDGICDRAFHQLCLEPPLLSEEIPSDNDGWLCPGCDCKVDCMDMLNDHQGTNLCIEDNWDSVFPEVTIIVDGENIESISLPSDDSEDNDYEPEVPEADEMTLNTSSESSSSAESNFTCSLEYLNVSTIGRKLENYGLSSDNSDDYDYHPGKHNHELSDQEGSSCEKSEYSSDSDELDTLKSDNGFLGTEQIVENLNEGKQALDIKKKPSNFELAMLISDLGPQYPLPISGRRRYEKLDYKKLHDETYGNAPSDSSDDEDWTSTTKMNKSAHTRTINVKLEVCKTKSGRKGTPKNFNITEKSLTQTNQEKLDDKGPNHSTCEQHQIYNCHRDAGDKTSKSGQKGFGQEIRQKLRESLKANLYPTRQTKENLAKELGLTVHQVSVWFANARRNKSLLMNIEISQKHDSTSFDNIPIIKIIAKNPQNSRDLTCSSDMANNDETK